jgi:hypothetical protein
MMLRSLSVLLLSSTAALMSLACGGGGIQHTRITDAVYADAEPPQLAGVGAITSIREHGGVLYVGGVTGVAAVGPDGGVRWTTELPATTFRYLDADAEGVAFTGYDLGSVDRATGAKKWFMGQMADAPRYQNAVVGMLSPAGQLVWTQPSSVETALSPPALSPRKVGVLRGQTFAVFDRRTGAEASADIDIPAADGMNKGFIAQATRNRPVFWKDHFWGGFYAYLVKVDESGKLVEQESGFGLFSPFQDITVGPVVFGDLIVFGTDHYVVGGGSVKKCVIFAADDEPDKEWKEAMGDTLSACGSIAISGERLFTASNFRVAAWNRKGSDRWEAVNKKGGLYPGSHRGVIYRGKLDFATRKSPNQLMVATATRVYVSSGLGDDDLITVLDAESGDYVQSIQLGTQIVDMALVDGRLAVATDGSVRFLAVE